MAALALGFSAVLGAIVGSFLNVVIYRLPREGLAISRPARSQCPQCAKGIAWFRFADICDGPRSQADYIEIARWYPSVIVSGVPRFDSSRDDQARRFIALVDEFYDRRVKLILSAEVEVSALYSGTRLAFEFERTVSRLIEMQSTDYLALPHLA